MLAQLMETPLPAPIKHTAHTQMHTLIHTHSYAHTYKQHTTLALLIFSYYRWSEYKRKCCQ